MKVDEKREVQESIDSLVALIEGVVPRAFTNLITWKLIATAFVARFGDQLRAIRLLLDEDYVAEAAVLLRSVYEHSVMFCWLAIDPPQRVQEWYEHTERGRLVAFDEAERDFGIQTPAQFQDERDRREMARLKQIPQLAREVDTYWSDELPAFRPIQRGETGLVTLTGMYTAVYRRLSSPAHAEAEALDPALKVFGNQVVVTREMNVKPTPPVSTIGLAIPITSLALVVYHHRFGGLDDEHIKGINAAFAERVFGPAKEAID